MRRAFVLILATLLLMGTMTASAENLYDKEIQFAEFDFGSTYAQVRSQTWVRSVEYNKRILPTRVIFDAASEISAVLFDTMSESCHFSVRLEGRKVAGYNAEVSMYFTFPDAGDRSDENAVFYAGVYQFYEAKQSAFEDLKGKLTKLYGEPLKAGTNSDEVFGEIQFDADDEENWHKSEWESNRSRYNPAQYVVWQSSVNDAMVVLKSYIRDGNRQMFELVYAWPEADQYFEALNERSGGTNNDMMGL